jgi:hypothetical protein
MITTILISITALFFVTLAAKAIIKKKNLCSICIAVSLTWIGLLSMYYNNMFTDIKIIALLMGMSLVGIYYIVEHHSPKQLTIFRLPFILTLILVSYFIITPAPYIQEVLFIAIMWALFGVAYTYRKVPALRKMTKKIIECCKRW